LVSGGLGCWARARADQEGAPELRLSVGCPVGCRVHKEARATRSPEGGRATRFRRGVHHRPGGHWPAATGCEQPAAAWTVSSVPLGWGCSLCCFIRGGRPAGRWAAEVGGALHPVSGGRCGRSWAASFAVRGTSKGLRTQGGSAEVNNTTLTYHRGRGPHLASVLGPKGNGGSEAQVDRKPRAAAHQACVPSWAVPVGACARCSLRGSQLFLLG
jgi:hypothetical protein